MSQKLEVHPSHPQPRMLRLVANMIRRGGIVVYPTDTSYALGCHLGDKNALERIVRIRRLNKNHQFTLCCRDLSELGTYARVDNSGYRLLRRLTPGPFTFVMKATREVPRRLLHPRRKSIGIRVPGHAVAQALLAEVAEPLLTTTVRMPDEDEPLASAEEISERIGRQVDAILDDGSFGNEVSTVLDLTGPGPTVIRQGVGLLVGV